MNHSEISLARRRIEKARMEKQRELMAAYDKEYYEEIGRLRRACGIIGHNFVFVNLGPLGDPWFMCTVCGNVTTEGK